MRKLAAFILTHGRPDNVLTYRTIRRAGYTGPIYLIIDHLDKTKDQYRDLYGDEVIEFQKDNTDGFTDSGDNSGNLNSVLYARNKTFEIAESLGIEYFIMLDDDYTKFDYRFNQDFVFGNNMLLKDLDIIFESLCNFYDKSGATSVAIAQGGDFIGGANCSNALKLRLSRKAMNLFVCSIKRPFKFIGRQNDDVNTYLVRGNTGSLFFTTFQLMLCQRQTQSQEGGLTEMYLQNGTYVKSFYSVMMMPSSVKVRMMTSKMRRLHHSVNWKYTVPKILSEEYKK